MPPVASRNAVPRLPHGALTTVARRVKNKATGKPVALATVSETWTTYWLTGRVKSKRILASLLRIYGRANVSVETAETAA